MAGALANANWDDSTKSLNESNEELTVGGELLVGAASADEITTPFYCILIIDRLVGLQEVIQ